jgi:NAD(P)-dependent dehydrogenase (short-subunit alcohol dehydrogenase family)
VARVLVTGANSGIGLASAIALARRGHDVLGTVRSDDKADRLAAAAREAGVPVRPVVLQLADGRDCERVVGGLDLDVLVNNAAYTNAGAIEDIDDDQVRDHLEVNLVAPVRMARLALPVMRARGGGRIVTVSSVLASFSLPLWGWYDATKRALDATMDSLRMEVARDGIDVMTVAPGAVRTPIYQREREELAALSPSRFGATYARWCRATRVLEPVMSRPDTLAATVVRAVEDEHPKARYLAGRGSFLGDRVAPLVPAGVRDRVFRRAFGLRPSVG